ncbi:flagellin FliC [bacterium]|nr:flagellin FliC [bacterium]
MALTINTNALALTSQRNLGITEEKMKKTIERLASGSRIVSAADDPAGLAISDGMNATIRSLNQAMRNAQDGISLIQVFEGGTFEINNMLIRLRELAMQSSSDTVGARERAMLNNEVQELKNEITRVARTTTYMDRELLAGEKVKLEFQVGTGNVADKDRILFDPGNTDLRSESLGVGDLDIRFKEDAQNALPTIDEAIIRVNEMRARIGSSQNRLQTTLNSQGVYRENMMNANSRIKDADMATETTNLARESILRQAGVAVLMQANETPRLALRLMNGG